MDDQVKGNTNAVRQGETRGHMRWVLAISLGGAVIAMAALYFWYS